MADENPRLCHLCGYRPTGVETTCPRHDLALVASSEHAKDPADPFLGRTLGGRYPVIGIVGGGGMGVVYRAIQEPVGREVAIKVIRNTADDRTAVRKRFEREARVIARLRHPNTITLHDFGVHDDGTTLYMVLELLSGLTLAQRLQQGPLPVPEACRIVAAVLDALGEAHRAGLVHRDIKPDNIMLVPNEWGTTSVKVLDFGIAKVVGDGTTAAKLTQTGMVFGTVRYMAPEQTWGQGVDARADIYALGVVLYEALAGRHPYDADDVLRLIAAHRQQPPAPMPASVPCAVAGVTLRALAKAPERRFQDAQTMAEALREASGIAEPDASGEVRLAPASGDVAEAEAEASPEAERDTIPLGGTSRELAAELVDRQAWPRQRPRLAVLAAATALAVVLVVAWWLVAPRPGSRHAAAPARRVPTTPADMALPSATPALPEAARAALAAGLERKAAGDLAGAATKLAQALRADPGHAAARYALGAVRALQGDGQGAVEALRAYLRHRPGARALGTRLRGDRDFDPVRAQVVFRSWLEENGLAASRAGAPRAASPPAVRPDPGRAEPAGRRRPSGQPARDVPAPPEPKQPTPAARPEPRGEAVDPLNLDLEL